jgi:TonB-linked SusC/RagA family outer membrane protein
MKHNLVNRLLLLICFFVANLAIGQNKKTISGTVLDALGGPLPGASVLIEGTTIGTQTDFDGQFTLEVSEGDTISFSYLGMITVTQTVSSENTLDVTLQEDTNLLDEVVLTGYSKQSTRNITGSVTVVDLENVAATSPVNVEQSLQGQASGVFVGSEGGPGGEALVRIRGFGTINNNDPLYIIDGTPTTTGLEQLNPADIESIQILKDASSAAIYGFRAGNGVIIITTKSGKYNSSSKLTLSINTGIDFVSESDFPRSISPEEMAGVIWQRFRNDGVAPSHPQYGNGPEPVLPNFLTPTGADTADLSTYDPLNNKITEANKSGTNWFDEYFDPALVQNYNLGLSGGTETAKFNVGLGLLLQDGVAIESYFDRFTFRVNSEFKVTPKIRIGESFNISYSNRVTAGGNQSTGGDISFLYRADPILPIYDVAGNYAGTQSVGLGNGFNSIAAAQRSKDDVIRALRALGNVYAEFDLLKDLTFKTNLGLDYDAAHWATFRFLNPEAAEPNAVNGLTENTSYGLSSTWYNTLNYATEIGDHSLNALLGTEYFQYRFKQFGGTRDDYFTNAIDYRYLDAGTGTSTNYGRGNRRAYFSAFGKIDYDYKDKYLMSFSLRRDATSRFAEDSRVGYFPSYSAAWRLSKEKFLENASFIDDLKIKLGYGELGNESIPQGRVTNLYGNNLNTSNYAISGSNNSVYAGYNLTSLGNPGLKWETTTTKNIGIDGILLDNALTFSFEYYESETKDMLLQSAGDITLIGHVTAPYANLGSMENKGFDFSIGYNGSIGEEFKFSASANISAYKNKILSLTDNPDYFLNGNAARETYPSRTQAGQALASFHGFVIDGIIQNQAELDATADFNGKDIGTFKYRDLNADGVIDDNDRTFIGDPHPDFTYGLNLNGNYKNFDLSLLFQGSQGNDIYNFTRFFTDFNSFPGGKSYRYLNSWSPDNTSGQLPLLTNNPAQHYSSASTYYIEDGSYLRLKNVQLGYNFPEELTSKMGMSSLKVFVQARNLFTWTDYSGLDPEVNLQNYGGDNVNLDIGIDRGAYPVARSILLGINLTM